MRLRQRLLALTCTAALAIQLGLPAMAVGTENEAEQDGQYPSYYTDYMIEALEQGDDIQGDAYTHKDTLFTASMVHNNPGLEPYTSNYNDSQFLADRDFDQQVFFLYDCAQYGLLWDGYDASQGITLTEEEWEADKEGTKEQNDKKVFPYGSEARAWVEAKRADLHEKYDAADEAGVNVYFMMDMIVLPAHLKEMRGDLLDKKGKIDISKEETQEVMDYMFQEMFTEFPTIDGIYIRYGETYTGSKYGDAAPYHTGNNPILHGEQSHMDLINYMGAKLYGDERVDEAYRDVIYRTWGFDGFQNTPSDYLRVSENIPTNEHLYFCVKHSTGDFHRDVAFNQTIGIGRHQQIVEVQCAREYEGKGAYPNFLIHGVINGMEEYEWLNPDDKYQSLRDVINSAEDPQVKGIWIWPRGGGWNGPYINGVNGIRDDNPYYAQGKEPRLSNPEVVIEDGSEMWNDLNAYVVTQWAKDTSKTDKYYVKQYAKEYLGMGETDAEEFYKLCILSERAVLLGRGTDDPQVKNKCNDTWWTRDQNIAPGKLRNNVNRAVNNNLQDTVLREKAECVAIWQEMLEIAQNLKTDAKLIDSPTVGVKDYIITTCKYGYYFFDITQQMYIAGIGKAEGDKTGVYDMEAIRNAVAEYDRLWAEWQELYETAPGCPSLFEKEDRNNNLIGYSGNRGTDAFMKDYRDSLSMDSTFQIGVDETAKLPVRYTSFAPVALTYESSNPAVATVSEDGRVTGVAIGKSLVTVRTESGLAASTLVTVSENSTVETKTLFEDDFSEDTSSSWTGNGTAAWNEVDGTLTISQTGSGEKNLQLPETFQGKLTASWRMKVDNTDHRAFVRLDDADGNHLTQVEFRGNQSGEGQHKIIVDAGDPERVVAVTAEDYQAETWYDVTVEIDTAAQTYTVKVGNETLSFNHFKAGASGVGRIDIGTRDDAVSITVDDIKIITEVMASEDILFENDFSKDNSGEWGGTNGTVDWVDGAIRVYGANGTSGDGRTLGLGGPHTGKLTASWRMKVDNTNDRAYVRLKDSNGSNLTQVEFRANQAGDGQHKIVVDTGVGNPTPLTKADYTADTWYDVSVDIDTDAQTYTVSIGNDMLTVNGFKDGNITDLGAIEVVARTSTVAISIDDVQVVSTPVAEISAEDLARTVTTLPEVRPDDTAVTLPVMPKGYTIKVKSCEPSLVDTDGTISFPVEDTEVSLVLQVINETDPADVADTDAISLLIPDKAEVPVESVSLDRDSLSLEEGDTYTLTATVLPENATNKAVTWSSSDTSVATVDQNGKVRAKDPGTAIITVTTAYGGFQDTCHVTVKAAVEDEDLLFEDDFSKDTSDGWTGDGQAKVEDGALVVSGGTSGEMVFHLPNQYQGDLTVTFKMKVNNATDRAFFRLANSSGSHIDQVEFRGSYDPGCVVVDTGRVGQNPDRAGQYTPNQYVDVKIELNTYNKTQTITVNGGTPYVMDYYKQDPGSDTAVSQLHIGTRGSAVFTVDDVRIVANEKVPVTGVTLNSEDFSLYEGQTKNVTATVEPFNATQKGVSWSTSNDDVVTVVDGKVTAVATGEADITVTTLDGGKSDSVHITVLPGLPLQTIPYTDKNIRYVGRWLEEDGAMAGYWCGASFEIRFKGYGCKVDMSADSGVVATVDGTAINIGSPKDEVDLSDYLDSNVEEHVVRITAKDYRNAKMVLKSIQICSEKGLEEPDDRLLIEVIGDSITAGAMVGNRCVDAYGNVCARLLDADCAFVAHDSISLLDKHSGGSYANVDGMNKQYFKTKPWYYDSTNSDWDFSTYTPDVVVINLGTNDHGNSNPVDTPEEDQEFIQVYCDFVDKIHKKYGEDTPVLMMIPFQHLMEEHMREIYSRLSEEGSCVYLVESADWVTKEAGDFADNYHPNAKGHQKIGQKLAEYVEDVLNASQTYTVTVETEGTGNANANVTEAKAGDTVTLTQQAAEGWHFVKWESNVEIAEDGTFTMPAENVTVTAVFEQDETDIKVESITVSASANIITEKDGTLQMVATVLPEGATDKTVTWSVETTQVKAEESAIEAETETAETVETEQPAEGAEAALVELEPAEAAEPVEGAGSEIATIDENGLLTALAEGTVKVTATANDGSGVTGTMEITIDFSAGPVVTNPITVVVNEEGAGTAAANLDKAAQGMLVTLMQSAANGWHFVGWESADADVTVDANGMFTMPGKPVTITAVFERDETVDVPVAGVTLDRDSLSLEEGDTYTLTATVLPENATNKAVTWSSSDTDVATVDENGKIRAKDPGTAIITVTTDDGDYTATCKVTVYEYDDGGSSSGGSSSRPEPRYDVELDVTGGSVKLSNTRPKAGDRVTVTLRPDAGMELERIEVVTEDGDTVKLTKVDEDEYTFRQPADDVTVRVVFMAVETEPEAGFSDVKDADWFAAAVDYVVEKGLMQGVGADLFQPQGLTDRAMVVTILYRLEGEPAVTGGQSFPDVAPGTWYAEAVRWASSEGIVDGYADGTFGPTDPVTREQLAAILYRYAGKPVVEVESKTFADSDQISSWAVEAMDWAVKSGVLSGKNGDLLDPTGTATRAEVAQILMNFCENVK